MDLVKHLNDSELDGNLDVRNLFKHGARVHWPGSTSPEFLSHKRTPALWQLGARPHLNLDESTRILEDIITCANVYHSSPHRQSTIPSELSVELKAYTELSIYLKYLFIHYNSKISDAALLGLDPQKYKFLNFINNSFSHYDDINIITYNYDIFLERLFMAHGIRFHVAGIQKRPKNKSIRIHKPHGSISFTYPDQKSGEYQINPDTILKSNIPLSSFRIKYSGLETDCSIVSAIIPPAGESSRYNFRWAEKIQEDIFTDISLNKNDKNPEDTAIFLGLSYWHVDRSELDRIITNLNPKTTIKLINPSPPSTLVAVLTSLFRNFILYTDASCIGG